MWMLAGVWMMTSAGAGVPAEDERLWLEEVLGEDALSWVRERNADSQSSIEAMEGFADTQQKILQILDSDDRIPYVKKREDSYYNFWKDAEHPRGLWRRTTLASYKTGAPEWDLVLDLDALSKEEGENWVWDGATCLAPDYTRCMVALSRGGSDASVAREFDLSTKSFVSDGFSVPEAKHEVDWINADTLLVMTDFGEGSLTESGYPRIVKEWSRGTPITAAKTIFEGEKEDVSVGGWHDDTKGYERDFVYRSVTFYTNKLFQRTKKGLKAIEKPDGTEVTIYRDFILFQPRKDWEIAGKVYPGGSLLVANYKRWMKGKRQVEALFTPTDHTSLVGLTATKSHLILETLEDVRSKILVKTPGKKGWTTSSIPGLPEFGDLSLWAVDSDESDAYWMTSTGFLTPTKLWLGEIGAGAPQVVKQTPGFFNTDNLKVEQHFATSKDGTKVPYFQISRKDLTLDGNNPTLLYGYGGFEISLLPSYRATAGVAWLERGGVYVIANIRGGGEYGPRWHQAALKQNRHRAYEDFAAVAEDLVKNKITRPKKLGIQGGSNGGLLMGNMYTLYPELFGAVVCQVPLLDMKRYTKLLAGASWAGEYGDPDDPEQWKFIQTFSPYHNIDPKKDYPPILFTTSTKDDRVHPGHARKMAHALLEVGKTVDYYENIEGGHGGAANNEQRAHMMALAYTYLWNQLNPPTDPSPAE